jgi:peptidoglycan/LPS O-acetylase OafA/YrhL
MSNVFKYRSDIDGLRALAVLLVVFYHAKFTSLSGGFIGVDVFFVISGFLISIIISKEVSEKRFSFKKFYLRRIKRLGPALIALLILTTIPAYLFLFSDDFEVFARNLIHAFLTTSNFFLWQNTGGYFAPNTDLFPLLHTWSLAVEEQFYFIWPALFILLYKLTKGRHLTALLFIALIGLTALSVYLANTRPHSAYFLLPARAFELMMGALLAVAYGQLPNLNRHINHVLSILGLALIIVPAFIISKESVFPGFNALWPCLGAVLLIITGKDNDKKGIVNTIISHRSFVFVGLISYSLYLWHWPIFVFIQYLGLELTGLVRVMAVLMAFMMGYLSWKFVEQPVRHMNLPTLGSAMKKIMLPAFITLTVIYGVIDVKNGFPERFDNLAEFDKKKNFPSTVRKKCHDADLIGNIDQCWLGTKKEILDGMLIGDSFGNHSASFIDVLARDAGLFIHDSTSGGHPILTRFIAPGVYDYPPEYAEQRLEYAMQFEHIIIGVNWNTYGKPTHLNYEILLSTIGNMLNQGKTISVVISLPKTTKENLHKLKLVKADRFVFFNNYDSSIPNVAYPDDHIINEMKRRYPQINYIDLRQAMCSAGRCNTSINDTIVYRNADHLNTSGAAMMAEKYIIDFGNPLKTVQPKLALKSEEKLEIK